MAIAPVNLNPIEKLWCRASCIIAKNKPKTRTELIEQVVVVGFE